MKGQKNKVFDGERADSNTSMDWSIRAISKIIFAMAMGIYSF